LRKKGLTILIVFVCVNYITATESVFLLWLCSNWCKLIAHFHSIALPLKKCNFTLTFHFKRLFIQ